MSQHSTSSRPNTRQTSSQSKTQHGGQQAENASSPKATVPSNADLQRDISNFSDKVLEKLDNLSSEIQSMNRRLRDVEASVEFNSSQIENIKKEIPSVRNALQDEISNLKEKILQMEIHNRKSNLLFYGIKEQQGENVYDTLAKVFVHLGIEDEKARKIQLVSAHRLPRRNPQASAMSSPSAIIAKFCFMADRDLVLTSFEMKQRAKTPVSNQTPAPTVDSSSQGIHRLTVRTDLPPSLKAYRGHLATVAYKLRKEKNLSTRIKLQGVKVILEWKEKGTMVWKLYEE